MSVQVTVDVDIEIDDYYSELSDKEKKSLVDWLKEDGFIKDTDLHSKNNNNTMLDDM